MNAPGGVFSHFQLEPIVASFQAGARHARLSPDLGRSVVDVELTDAGVVLPDGSVLPWDAAAVIAESRNACFRVLGGQAEPIRLFSDATQRVYSLMPTPGAPTLLVSGIYMHRVKGTDPIADTEAKVASVAPIVGDVLDTTTGLGYTALTAARSARRVLTVELDPAVLEIAEANPWSEELFTNPAIERRLGDAVDVVAGLPSSSFDRVVHDPPTLSLAGHLYSADFYVELYRVLRPGGRLFHYVGNPSSSSGARVGSGVVQRLRRAGFARVVPRPEAFGFLASKSSR